MEERGERAGNYDVRRNLVEEKEDSMGLRDFAKFLVIAMAALILSVSAKERKAPEGLLEWLFLMGSLIAICV